MRGGAAGGRERWARWVSLLARLVLAGVWIYAASTKIGRPLTSARAVQAYEIFPFDVAAMIGQALPIIELALGILLLIGLFTRVSAALSLVLLAVFVAGIASAWARGLQIDCGCFGGDGSLALGQEPQYLQEILRDIGYAACAAWLVWRPRSPYSVDSRLEPSPAGP